MHSGTENVSRQWQECALLGSLFLPSKSSEVDIATSLYIAPQLILYGFSCFPLILNLRISLVIISEEQHMAIDFRESGSQETKL